MLAILQAYRVIEVGIGIDVQVASLLSIVCLCHRVLLLLHLLLKVRLT